ncbi:hypothetical protein OHD10_25440 [Escherichia coli]|uniref:hypothetical protein n=1 Tax=Escherichia coli TaxID=562 RepID=UPI002239005C|nr:hypothetical protein [Escherichia coli]MCW7402878.1 hypothetical protein [Escherichia coli]
MLLEKKEVEKVNRTAFKDRVGELKKDRNLFFLDCLASCRDDDISVIFCSGGNREKPEYYRSSMGEIIA